MLTELEKDVLEIIKEHVGYINQEEIADEYRHKNIVFEGMSYTVNKTTSCRSIRKAIASLINQGYPIISTPRNRGGYHWQEKPE